MRYFKVLFFLLLFFLSMVFFAQNMEVLSQPLAVGLNLFNNQLFSIEFPFYMILLTVFVVGAALMVLFFLFEKFRVGRELSKCRKKLRTMEQEVNSLRNLPLEDANFPVDNGGDGESKS